MDRLVVGNLGYVWGTGSSLSGTGVLTVALPVPPLAPLSGEAISIGSGLVFHTGGNFTTVALVLVQAYSAVDPVMVYTGAAVPVSYNTPIVWDDNDAIQLDFAYQCAAD